MLFSIIISCISLELALSDNWKPIQFLLIVLCCTLQNSAPGGASAPNKPKDSRRNVKTIQGWKLYDSKLQGIRRKVTSLLLTCSKGSNK